MTNFWDIGAVVFILLLAVIYLFRRYTKKGVAGGCGCGCDSAGGCSGCSGGCGIASSPEDELSVYDPASKKKTQSSCACGHSGEKKR